MCQYAKCFFELSCLIYLITSCYRDYYLQFRKVGNLTNFEQWVFVLVSCCCCNNYHWLSDLKHFTVTDVSSLRWVSPG